MGSSKSKSHYDLHHSGKPHEYIVNGVQPRAQEVISKKNEGAYIGLYVAMAVGVLFLIILFIKFLQSRWSQNKLLKDRFKRNIQGSNDGMQKEKAMLTGSKIYPEIEKGSHSYTGSAPSMTTTTAEVQPKETLPKYDKLDETKPQQGFGVYNVHHQQPLQTNCSSSETNAPFTSEAPSTASSNVNLDSSSSKRHLSREESFPYEKYNMPVEDRVPIKTRVVDMKPFSSYFKLAPEPSFQEDEPNNDEGESSGIGTNSSGGDYLGQIERKGSRADAHDEEYPGYDDGSRGEQFFSAAQTLHYEDTNNQATLPKRDHPSDNLKN